MAGYWTEGWRINGKLDGGKLKQRKNKVWETKVKEGGSFVDTNYLVC